MWIAGRRVIRGSTESGYGSIIKCQLIPRLGSYLLANLRFEHIDAAVSGMIEDELFPKTIRNAVTLLRGMLIGKKAGSAARRGLMIHDPTLGIELPPLDQREIVPPTPEQVWTLINSAKAIGGIGYPATYIGGFTGVRRNEALGLRFCDVKWFDNELRVEHAISKRRGTDGAHKWEWHLGPLKTRRSRRSVNAPESVMKLLADLKVGKQDSDFILPEAGGGFIDPDKFSADIWKPIADAAKMPGTRFHDLRHFFASQHIANRELASYVRDQMGHSSIKVTLDTYGHLFPGRGAESSERYEKSMERARVKSEPDVSKMLAIEEDGEESKEVSN
jgi:integrase